MEAAIRGVKIQLLVSDVYAKDNKAIMEHHMVQSICPLRESLQSSSLSESEEKEEFGFEVKVKKAFELLYAAIQEIVGSDDTKQAALKSHLEIKLSNTLITAHTVIIRYDGCGTKCFYTPYLPRIGAGGSALFHFEKRNPAGSQGNDTDICECVTNAFNAIWEHGTNMSMESWLTTGKVMLQTT
jgi:hypothetical protein